MPCRSFAQDRTLMPRLFELLDICFPGISEQAVRISLKGSSWEETSTPFVMEHPAGRLIAHIGLLSVPAIICGQKQILGALHAVCTHPAQRRHGFCRALIEEVIAFAEERHHALMLTTSSPAIYQQFGFRVVPEYRFDLTVNSPGQPPGFRPMSLRDSADLLLLEDLLSKRQPVSEVFGVTGDERGSFSFYCPDPGLWYSPELNTIAWLQIQGAALRIHDIIAPEVPRLSEILDLLPFAVRRVEMLFSPDRLQTRASPVPYRHEDSYLMIRGPFVADGLPFMVPPTARC